MPKSKISTAAFLAGATTLAVSLPVMAAERSYDLDKFDGVSISSGLSAEVSLGTEFSIVAEARSRRALDQLDIQVRNGTLVVKRESSWKDFSFFTTQPDATIKIIMPSLTNVAASAGSDVYVVGATGGKFTASSSSGSDLDLVDLNLGRVQFDVSSGSELNAQGMCETLDARASSGSNMDASDLICQTVDAHASSGSDIEVYAAKSVNGRASSGADVSVSGSPETVNKRESSGGDVDVN